VTRHLHVRDEAEIDVIDAVAWYEGQRVGLDAEFLIELDAIMLRVATTPLRRLSRTKPTASCGRA
jgi:hypothetical protein